MNEIPEISVAVCTYNRADVLPKCLESLVNQTVDKELFEVLIIDNNSTDGTKEIATDFCKENLNFRYIFEEKQGLSHARNRAVDEAKGKYIAYIDDDAIADKEWLQSIFDCFSQTNADVVGGPVFHFVNAEKQPIFYNKEWFSFNPGNERKRMMPPGFNFGFLGGNTCFKKSLFDEFGKYLTELGMVGGKQRMGEDSEMGYRLLKAGKVFYYEPKMKIDHQLRLKNVTLKGILKRSYDTGIEIGRMIKNDIPIQKKLKKTAAPFVYTCLFLALFPFYWIKGPWFFAKKLGDIFFALGVAINVW
jgi:glycosyltransferase involved in cell wall biosynthesis